MFKRKNVNFRWPATLSFVTESGNENERFSRGHLKVFYKGETADHRFFSDQFAEELVKSLPYTPIVSHYDEEKDDFVGHATEQDIYGIVDPRGEVTFEKDENGITWAICDTVYYTERPDKVGEIAKKIEGHSQSLELDPSTVKYKVNYDERKHFKNIEFTAGHFIGVSVLGDDQEPAFTGSAFFASNEQFAQKMEILKNYCEGNTDPLGESKIMNPTEFLKLSWGDICSKFCEAVEHEYGSEYYTYPVDFYDDCGIFRFYSYFDGSIKLMKIYYTRDEDGNITLGNITETHVVYEDLDVTEHTGDNTFSTDSENFATDSEHFSTDSEEGDFINLDGKDLTTITTDVPMITVTVEEQEEIAQAATLEKVSAVSEDKDKQEASSAASFTESERAELETLKREKKIALITEYEMYLSDEERTHFTEEVDSYSYESLETALLKVYKAYTEKQAAEEDDTYSSGVSFVVPTPNKPETAEQQLDSYIRRMLGK